MKRKLQQTAAILGFVFVTFMTTTASAFTAVASGNWSSAATWGGTAPGGTVSSQDITIPSGITVNLDMDVTFSGLINSFTVSGTLNNSSAHSVTISQGAFAGAGSVNIDRIKFTALLATMSYTGTMMVNHFENTGATLTVAAIISVADTLNLDAGSMLLNSGANLSMMTNSVVRVNSGSMTIGGGIFNSGSSYSVVYVGSSKTSGIEINTTSLKDLYVELTDNTQSLTLGGNLIVNGGMHLSSGKLDFSGKQLTLNGNLITSTGTMFTSSASSTMTVGDTTSLTNGLMFSSGSAMNDLIINNNSSTAVKLMSALSISGNLKLMHGSFSLESGSTLTMSAGSTVHIESGSLAVNTGTFTGTAAYNVEYMGSSATNGVELTGSGLTDLTVQLSSSSNTMTMNNDVTMSGALTMVTGKLDLNGKKLIVNGTLDQNSATGFVGGTPSELQLNLTTSANDTLTFDASGNTIGKLTVNIPSGSTLYLGHGLYVATNLYLTSGKLDIGNNDLVIQSTGAVSGYSNTNYIVTSGAGSMQMHVNSASTYVTFPVGTTTGYSPAYVQQTASGTSGDFTVHTMEGVYSNGTSSGWNSAGYGSVVNRTWWVSASSGTTVNTNLKLGWTSAEEVNGFDRMHSYITHYNGSAWDTHTVGAATSGASSTYEMERTGLTSLSPFAVVDSTAGITLGIQNQNNSGSVTISLYPNPTYDVVSIEIQNSNDTYKYELIDITGKTLKVVSNKDTVNSFDLSNLSEGFYFVKATNLATNKVITKRVIKS